MIDRADKGLSITKQAELLSLNRTGIYYKPVPTSQVEYDIKWLIDEIYTLHPEFGYRTMTTVLNRDYLIKINKKRTRRYMREMGLHGICPGPNLSKRSKAAHIYPYLLRKMSIIRPNQVWSIDITYCRMPHGHMYLVAIVDWFSRYVVGYELSNTMDKTFVLTVVKKAIARYGTPEIMNSDQGSQFTSDAYINLLKEKGIKISMDGKGRALDNIRIERFWRSLKWQKLYISEYETPKELKALINEYIPYYNQQRPHQSLADQTPSQVYFSDEKAYKKVI